ncbi:MAG: MraY family glycosyltransferase [Arenicella sp.]
MVLIFFLAVVLSAASNGILMVLAPRYGLIAVPGQHRDHAKATPLTGGIAIFIAVVASLVITQPFVGLVDLLPFLLAAALLVVVGVIDDKHNLPFFWRLLVQVFAAWIMVQHSNILFDLGELFSNKTLFLGRFSTVMTIFATVGVINAINMSDGLDGLAGSQVLLALCVLSLFWFEFPYDALIVVTMGAISGFLLFNCRFRQHHARVFMGDAGSTLLGFLLAWLLINGSQQVDRLFDPIFAVWLLALPLFDTISVMLIRPLYGRSPFSADKIHLHHHIFDRVGSVNLTLLFMLVLFLAYAAIGMVAHHLSYPQAKQTIVFSVLFLMHLLIQWRFSRQKILQETIV